MGVEPLSVYGAPHEGEPNTGNKWRNAPSWTFFSSHPMATHLISWEKRMCKKGGGRISKTKMLGGPLRITRKKKDTQKKRGTFQKKICTIFIFEACPFCKEQSPLYKRASKYTKTRPRGL